ncbi:substrate-binding periplasmic protein [Roseateles toxinivorans]|uniref:Polar amino acid transport system substrate-binding protein n=1 Tax=Roseateles toxinivorans TaxID=270368 RepID=A0A4R6QBP7_9BURK|nr:transporter substrate-binding domain-containing protein [Roseateles toxinivorans]TDP59695.1 polar amino acid transport system substrate-binding protein [Roseateles toxinivorans]
MRTLKILLSLAALSGTCCVNVLAQAPANPDKVSICHENEDAFPWLLKAKPGYSQIMIQHLEKQLGVPVKLVAMPWKQCLAELKSGAVDAAMNASFSKDRAEFAHYPMKMDGDADATKRMYRTSYALYKAKGAAVSWDGQKLSTAGTVGAQTGFSIVNQLKELGVKVEDSSPTADELLGRVASGRYVAAALQTTEAENTLAGNAALGPKLERLNPALVEKAYYTIFSKPFFAKHGQTARDVWRLEAKIRESAEFKASVSHLMKSVD